MKRILAILTIFMAFLLLAGDAGQVFAEEKVSEATAILVANASEKDRRVEHLRAYLSSHTSPLTTQADHFVAEADRFKLDWKLVAAIAGVESTFGKHLPLGSYNAWGWGIPTGASWGEAFPSWQAGIAAVSQGLRTNYLDRGAVTIEQIGHIYAASPAWPGKVRYFLDQIESYLPARPDLIEVSL